MIDALDLHRTARRLHGWRVPLLPRLIRRVTQFLYGSFLPPEAEIGEGTELGYGGLGVVMHPEVRVGRNCFIGPQVTIGGRSGVAGAPVIEDAVCVNAGARLLGNIRIGAGAIIGANAVVVCSVPAGAVVGGIPARELRKEQNAPENVAPAAEARA